ncbi:Clp protease [Hymenobacter gelipurpurascens]|uniref:Clp protease n=1 Tax=Hymenobacter gelipurpurascens TaxID=89968 RepID=A0A212TMQ7_9BACT|nr:ATP-dependent Clp protease proteolytic subunit [Hymenobacter gelipurpurascens]SNC67339.1 Clp protease [Hymenobacter gelipurpurascens]
MPELLIPIREYIGTSEFNWDTYEFEWATNADDVRMMVEWAQYDGLEVDSICLEIGVCYGGSVLHGMEIYNYLKGLGLPIRTRILSLAASMGSVIPLVGDEIEIEQTAQILVHGPSSYAAGTVREITSDLKQLNDLLMKTTLTGKEPKFPMFFEAPISGGITQLAASRAYLDALVVLPA